MEIVTSTLIGAVLGFGAAWLLVKQRFQTPRRDSEPTQPEPPEKRPEVKDWLQQVLEVATRLDGDVGRHSHQLNAVNQGLKETLGDQPSQVVNIVHNLLDANVQMRNELQATRAQIAQKQQGLETSISEARIDTLTRLKNRRSFNEELNRQFAQRQRQGIHFSLLMIDVDHFKNINDVYGHLAGDLILRSVAQTLLTTLREMDVVCRYGGEEFAVICPGSTLAEAAAGAERARVAIAEQATALKEEMVQVTVSIGIAEVGESEIAEALIQRADEALYAAKHAGRNRVHLQDGQASAACLP